MYLIRRASNTEDESVQQDAKVKELKAAFEPLSGSSKEYCTDSCLRRHLIARNWNVDKAKKMVEETLKWRSTFKPDEICWHEVANEGVTGKAYRANFHDRLGRTVLITRPAMQKTVGVAEDQVRHLVYIVENAIFNLPEGQEQSAWLIDFTGWSLNHNVPMKTAREIINVLQNHYPERLGIAFMYNAPKLFEAFWMVVKYFLDQRTTEKLKFIYPENKDSMELMAAYFDEDNLPIEFGGKAKLQYDYEEFSRLMIQDEVKIGKARNSDEKAVPVNDI